VVKPDGAFYVFPSIKSTKMKSFDFALKLLQETSVAVVPGDAFSEFGEGYVRISYAASIETLEEGLDRIEQFVHSIKRNLLATNK
jgi:aminotransferase